MNYLNKTFSVFMGNKKYNKNYDKIFKKSRTIKEICNTAKTNLDPVKVLRFVRDKIMGGNNE